MDEREEVLYHSRRGKRTKDEVRHPEAVSPPGGEAASEENKLIALIYPDQEQLNKAGITEATLNNALDTIRKDVNSHLPEYMAVTKFRVHPEEFVKTPKRSIKRYLYMKE